MSELQEYLISIGKMVVNFNAAENSVRRLCWKLIDDGNDEVGKAVTKDLDASGLEILAQRLIKIRLQNPLFNEARKHLQEFEKARNGRNDFAHAMLSIPNDSDNLGYIEAAWSQHRKKGRHAVAASPKLSEKAKEVSSLSCQCGEGIDGIIGKL